MFFRVKAVDCFSAENYVVLVTASNDGFIKMWKLVIGEVIIHRLYNTICCVEKYIGDLKIERKYPTIICH